MKNQSFNILFIMRSTRIKKNGLASIYARITTGGMRQELYTRCDGNPELWDQKKERALGADKLSVQVNETFNEFRAKIMEVRRTLQAEGYEANALQIKRHYLNPRCDTLMLIEGLTDYCKRRQDEVGIRITQRTADKYDRLLRYLKEYLAKRGKGADIPVENINYEFLDGFNLFLQTAHRCRHNGAIGILDCARHTFACMAVEYGMPIDVLAKILGHTNTNMTRHYAKFSETVIGRETAAFGKRLNSLQ